MRIWSFEINEYDKTSVKDGPFDGGYVHAETFTEASEKVKKYYKEAWGGEKGVKLMITKLEYEHDVIE